MTKCDFITNSIKDPTKESADGQFKGINIIHDNIHNPKHYQGAFGLEAIEVIKNFAGDLTAVQGFYWGNAIKYMLRFQQKNGIEDLKKARKNMNWLIEELEVADDQ